MWAFQNPRFWIRSAHSYTGNSRFPTLSRSNPLNIIKQKAGDARPPSFCFNAGIYWTKFECISSWILMIATNLRASSAPFGRNAKPKNFPYLSSFLGGGWGGWESVGHFRKKKWKGNFWFCFAVSILDYTPILLSSARLDKLQVWKIIFPNNLGQISREYVQRKVWLKVIFFVLLN